MTIPDDIWNAFGWGLTITAVLIAVILIWAWWTEQ